MDGVGLGSVGAKYLRPVGAVKRSSCDRPGCSRALFFEGACDHQSKSGGHKDLQDMYEGRNNARYIANGQRHGRRLKGSLFEAASTGLTRRPNRIGDGRKQMSVVVIQREREGEKGGERRGSDVRNFQLIRHRDTSRSHQLKCSNNIHTV
jgi:hypothetical protein